MSCILLSILRGMALVFLIFALVSVYAVMIKVFLTETHKLYEKKSFIIEEDWFL